MNHARTVKDLNKEVPPDRAALRWALGNCGSPARAPCRSCDKAIDEFLAAQTPKKEEVSADDRNAARD